MPTITVNIDNDLKERMEEHPEINWSEVTRQAIEQKVEILDVMDELTTDSQLTEDDIAELADRINATAGERIEDDSTQSTN